MIQLRSKPEKNPVFFAVCSLCGVEGPEEISPRVAHEAVIARLWSYRIFRIKGLKVIVYTCNICLPPFDNSPIYATQLDPNCEVSDADPNL